VIFWCYPERLAREPYCRFIAFICSSPTAAPGTNGVLHAPGKTPATMKDSSRQTWDERQCAQNLHQSTIVAGPSAWRAWKKFAPAIAEWAGPATPAIPDHLPRDSGKIPAPARRECDQCAGEISGDSERDAQAVRGLTICRESVSR